MRIDRRVASDTVSRPAADWESAVRLQLLVTSIDRGSPCHNCAATHEVRLHQNQPLARSPPFREERGWVDRAWVMSSEVTPPHPQSRERGGALLEKKILTRLEYRVARRRNS